MSGSDSQTQVEPHAAKHPASDLTGPLAGLDERPSWARTALAALHVAACWLTEVESQLPQLYLALVGLALIPFLFLQAPFQTSDAFSQFARAVELVRGQVDPAVGSPAGVGVMLPTSVAKLFYIFWPLLLHRGVAKVTSGELQAANHLYWTSKVTFVPSNVSPLWPNGSGIYSGVLYIPQMVALEAARTFHLSLLTAYYLVAGLNGICASLLSWWALRIAKFGRPLMLGVLLLPMTLSIYFSVSQDALLIALGAVLFALLTRALVTPPATVPEYRLTVTWLAALGCLFSMNRPTNLPIFLLLLLVRPPSKTADQGSPAQNGPRMPIWYVEHLPGRQWTVAVGAGFAAAAATIFLVAMKLGSAAVEQPGASIRGQLLFQLRHPLTAGVVFANSVLHEGVTWIDTFIGQLGWNGGGPFLGRVTYVTILIALVAMAVVGAPRANSDLGSSEGNRFARTRWLWILVAVAFGLICWVLTVEVLYLGWSPVGYPLMTGSQGRYFLPVAFFLGLAAFGLPRWRRITGLAVTAYVGISGLAVLSCTGLLLNFFWIGH